MIFTIIDTETDGLVKTVTKIHCMCIHTVWEDGTTSTVTFRTHAQIVQFIQQANRMENHTIVGHNFIRFDQVVLKKILGISFTCPIMDSLAFSWVLYPQREDHNLSNWGYDLGVEKPVILDWSSDNIDNIINRCEADVQINLKLFNIQYEYLLRLYQDETDIQRFIGYIKFKMECAAEQEEVKWRLDVKKCEENLQFLRTEIQPKLNILSSAMPRAIKYKDVERPDKFLKKDGDISVAGQKWLDLLASRDLPEYHVGSLQVEVDNEPGNPNSHQQLKAWLFSMGWAPDFYKYSHLRDNSINKIPQINNQDGSSVCDSVIALLDKAPALAELDNLTKLKHRIGLLEGFQTSVDSDGFLTAEIMGLTNTLRFQHTKIVNLPTVVKAYAGIVREVLIAPDGNHILCGSDMAGIEEATKHHYMYFYDPELVKKIRTPGFDPHLNLAVEAKLCTEEDIKFYKDYEKAKESCEVLSTPFTPTTEEQGRHTKIKDIRINKGKKANFGAVYGAGPAKLALTAGIPIREAAILHRAFWTINRSVKLVAKYTRTRTIANQMWLYNPVSGFWYTLRAEKDKFSTLNQSTAVYCFDMQVRNVRKKGVKMCGQFHDEWVAPILREDRDRVKTVADKAIEETNNELRLNVKLGIDTKFGNNYADIH